MVEVLATIPPEPQVPRYEEGPEREEWDAWGHEAARIREVADEHAAIAVVFACAACELYINNLGGRALGDSYFEKHLDRLDLVSKWVVIPRLVHGHVIDKGGRAFELLRLLVGARNELMHPKSEAFDWDKFDAQARKPPKSRFVVAREAIEALDILGAESEKFDPDGQGAGLYDHEEQMQRQWARVKE